jgi:cell division protein FtsB
MFADRELAPGLQKLLEQNSPMQFNGKKVVPVMAEEKTEAPYFQDVFQNHMACTQNKQTLCVMGVPIWLKPNSMKVTEDMLQQKVQEHQANWTVADLLMRVTPQGLAKFASEGVFKQVLRGNRKDAMILTYDKENAIAAWKCQEAVAGIITRAAGNSSTSRLHTMMYPPVQIREDEMVWADPEMEEASRDEDSMSSNESSEPPKRKDPVMERAPAVDQSLNKAENILAQLKAMADSLLTLETKLEKLSVSMTSMSTEVSDLKSSSEAMAQTSTIAKMSDHELESFINERCIPQFVSRMEEHQVKAIVANSNANHELLRESAQTIFAEVVRDQLHRSYPTAELALVTTFRKCLEEAVQEIGKVIERNMDGEINAKAGEQMAAPEAQGDEPSPPSQEFPSLYRGWNEEHSKGADRTLGSALQEIQKGVADMIAEGEENTGASEHL